MTQSPRPIGRDPRLGAPSFERLRKAVCFEEPDRVPLVEALVERPIMSQFLGRTVEAQDIPAQVEFWASAGYDYVPLTVGMMAPGRVTEDSPVARAVRQKFGDTGESNLEYTSFICDQHTLESFPWQAAAGVDLSLVETACQLLSEGMKLVLLSGKVYTLASMLMGFERFATSLADRDGLAPAVVEKVAHVQSEALMPLLSLPEVGAVWAVDDVACSTGPMLSPQTLRVHLWPYYRDMVAACHQRGKLVFFHSDGNILPLLDDLVELGVDALHPVDPTVLDIARVKDAANGRIALFGNVSTELLRSGTPDEVRAEVKRLISCVAPGGGYCIGSGNSVPSWASLSNYRAMLDAAAEYGAYPISV